MFLYNHSKNITDKNIPDDAQIVIGNVAPPSIIIAVPTAINIISPIENRGDSNDLIYFI